MHPELLSSLAAEHRRDLNTAMAGRAALRPRTASGRPAAHRRWPLPRLRVSWTHTSLAAVSGRRGRSVMIVISATRPS